MFDKLLDHQRYMGCNRLLETHDLISLSVAMRSSIEWELSQIPPDWSSAPESLLALDYVKKLHLSVALDEIQTMERYTTTVAICKGEADIIQKKTRRTRVVTVPATSKVTHCDNDYHGPALFVAGQNNPFNVHGCLVFAKKVLPLILKHEPEFQIQLAGDGSGRIPALTGLAPVGFIPDIASVYGSASFFICPVVVGTGQQIKILEAMAHGLAVVAWRQRAGDAPIVHGQNGFLCDSAEEFASSVICLWRDKALCRDMGREAQSAIGKKSAAFLPALQDAVMGFSAPESHESVFSNGSITTGRAK